MRTIHWARYAIRAGALMIIGSRFQSEPFLSVTPATLRFTEGSTQQSFEINTNRDWTLEPGDAAWLWVSPMQGRSGKTTVQVSVEPNISFAQPKCGLSVRIAGQKAAWTIEQ